MGALSTNNSSLQTFSRRNRGERAAGDAPSAHREIQGVASGKDSREEILARRPRTRSQRSHPAPPVRRFDCEMIAKNPVRLEGRPGDSAERGAQPFTGDQLTKLRQAANEDLLAYLLLRWTGLRGSDAVRLAWHEIDWEALEINRLTQKRKKRVILPIHQELRFALEIERDKRG